MGKRKQEEVHNSQKDNLYHLYALGNQVFSGVFIWKIVLKF